MKLPNGYGTVSKMKGNLRKPWRVITPENRKTIGYVATKKEGIALLAEYHKNKQLFLGVPTIEDLFNRFLPTKKGKSESTIAMYKTSWIYFEDLKDVPVNELKSYHLQDLINNLVDEGLSYSTVHKVKTLASQIYKLGMQDDYIDKNYAQFIELPKKPKPDNSIFSDIEIEKILEYSKSNYWAKVMAVMIFTCMRPNEVLNVTKFNVNMQENYIIGGGKTEAGQDRYIPIFHKIQPLISQLLKTSTNEYLICHNGSKVNYRYYLDKHYEVLEFLEIQQLSPHKCRKTGATFYQRSGMDRTALQRIMGHKDYKTTDQYYLGVIKEEIQHAMENIK